MKMRRVIVPTLLGFSVLMSAQEQVLAPASAADANIKLAPRYAGNTSGVNFALNVAWSLTVREVLPDGTVHGKITYRGARCGVTDGDFTGKFDGTVFTIPMPFVGGGPACQGWEFRLTRQKDSNSFDGLYDGPGPSGRPIVLKITLTPE